MKIAIFTVNPSFLAEVEKLLSTHHWVRRFKRTDNDMFNLVQIQRLVDWCDLAYFEFAQYPLNVVSALAAMDKPLVVRAHGIELWQQKSINWEKVSLLIVTPICRKIFMEQKPEHVPKILELPIGADSSVYTFSPQKENKKFGKKIVMQSTVMRPKKRVYTTIQLFSEVYEQDNEWELYIVGNWKSVFTESSLTTQEQYNWPIRKLIDILGLDDKIWFTPQMPKNVWAEFLHNKDIYWSNSILEGFQCSLAEAMLTGVFPVINNWWGADKFYPANRIHKKLSSMVKAILEWGDYSADFKYEYAKESRKAILNKNMHIKHVAQQIKGAIESVRKRKK